MEKNTIKNGYLRASIVAGALAVGMFLRTPADANAYSLVAQQNTTYSSEPVAYSGAEHEYYKKSIAAYHKTKLYHDVRSMELAHRYDLNLNQKAQLQSNVGKGFLFYLVNKAREKAGLSTVDNMNLIATEQHALYVGLSKTTTTTDGLAMTPNMRNNVYGGHEYIREVVDYISYKERIPSSAQTEMYVANAMYSWLNTPKYRARILNPNVNEVSISLWFNYVYTPNAQKRAAPYGMSIVLDNLTNDIRWLYNSPIIFSNGNVVLTGKTTPELLRSLNNIEIKQYPSLSFKNSYAPRVVSNNAAVLNIGQYGITSQNGAINVSPQVQVISTHPLVSTANGGGGVSVVNLFNMPGGKQLLSEGYKVAKRGQLPTAPPNVHLPSWVPKTMNGTEYVNNSTPSNQNNTTPNGSNYLMANPSAYQTFLNYNNGTFKMCFNINEIIRINGSMQAKPGVYEMILKNSSGAAVSTISVFVNNNGPYNVSYAQIPKNFWAQHIRR